MACDDLLRPLREEKSRGARAAAPACRCQGFDGSAIFARESIGATTRAVARGATSGRAARHAPVARGGSRCIMRAGAATTRDRHLDGDGHGGNARQPAHPGTDPRLRARRRQRSRRLARLAAGQAVRPGADMGGRVGGHRASVARTPAAPDAHLAQRRRRARCRSRHRHPRGPGGAARARSRQRGDRQRRRAAQPDGRRALEPRDQPVSEPRAAARMGRPRDRREGAGQAGIGRGGQGRAGRRRPWRRVRRDGDDHVLPAVLLPARQVADPGRIAAPGAACRGGDRAGDAQGPRHDRRRRLRHARRRGGAGHARRPHVLVAGTSGRRCCGDR